MFQKNRRSTSTHIHTHTLVLVQNRIAIASKNNVESNKRKKDSTVGAEHSLK